MNNLLPHMIFLTKRLWEECQQLLNETRQGILVEFGFLDPEVVGGQDWTLVGVKEVEVGIEDTVCQDVLHVLAKQLTMFVNG